MSELVYSKIEFSITSKILNVPSNEESLFDVLSLRFQIGIMQAEIITIGDEILIGQTIDTNSAWMGKMLNEVGIDIHQVRSIRDSADSIVDALNSIESNTRLVLITGGLGPTKDDLTKYTLNEYFGGELVYHEEIFEHIKELFAKRGRVPNEMNRGQAELPSACEPIFNPHGTASGMRFEKNGVYFISMPGVPYEMKGIMETGVLPWILETFNLPPLVHRNLLTHNVPESELASTLEEWENNLPPHIKLAYLPSAGAVKLRLSAKKGDPAKNIEQMIELFAQARTLIGDAVYGEDAETMEEVVGRHLKEMGCTVATAESCTGGAIGSTITSIPGSSAYFVGGVMAYSNEVKIKTLGVNEADILMHGAVSEPVVIQMARGVAKRMGTDYAVSTSGVAGPDGGSEEKPVGTVWIGVHGPNGTNAYKFTFGHNRSRNIKRSVLMALDLLRKQVLADQQVKIQG